MEANTSNPHTVSGITLEPSTESEKKPWTKPKLVDLQASDTEGKTFSNPYELNASIGPS